LQAKNNFVTLISPALLISIFLGSPVSAQSTLPFLGRSSLNASNIFMSARGMTLSRTGRELPNAILQAGGELTVLYSDEEVYQDALRSIDRRFEPNVSSIRLPADTGGCTEWVRDNITLNLGSDFVYPDVYDSGPDPSNLDLAKRLDTKTLNSELFEEGGNFLFAKDRHNNIALLTGFKGKQRVFTNGRKEKLANHFAINPSAIIGLETPNDGTHHVDMVACYLRSRNIMLVGTVPDYAKRPGSDAYQTILNRNASVLERRGFNVVRLPTRSFRPNPDYPVMRPGYHPSSVNLLEVVAGQKTTCIIPAEPGPSGSRLRQDIGSTLSKMGVDCSFVDPESFKMQGGPHCLTSENPSSVRGSPVNLIP
jgi:hypothetical protein